MPSQIFTLMNRVGWYASFAALCLSSLPQAVNAQERVDNDGILTFQESGASYVEFVFTENLGWNRLPLLLAEGEPFGIEDGFCQIAALRQAPLVLNYALGLDSDGNWVAVIAPAISRVDRTDSGFASLGVQCFLHRQ